MFLARTGSPTRPGRYDSHDWGRITWGAGKQFLFGCVRSARHYGRRPRDAARDSTAQVARGVARARGLADTPASPATAPLGVEAPRRSRAAGQLQGIILRQRPEGAKRCCADRPGGIDSERAARSASAQAPAPRLRRAGGATSVARGRAPGRRGTGALGTLGLAPGVRTLADAPRGQSARRARRSDGHARRRVAPRATRASRARPRHRRRRWTTWASHDRARRRRRPRPARREHRGRPPAAATISQRARR